MEDIWVETSIFMTLICSHHDIHAYKKKKKNTKNEEEEEEEDSLRLMLPIIYLYNPSFNRMHMLWETLHFGFSFFITQACNVILKHRILLFKYP